MATRATCNGGYVAVVDARWSDEDRRRSRSEWFRSETLHDLYLQVGQAVQVPQHRMHR